MRCGCKDWKVICLFDFQVSFITLEICSYFKRFICCWCFIIDGQHISRRIQKGLSARIHHKLFECFINTDNVGVIWGKDQVRWTTLSYICCKSIPVRHLWSNSLERWPCLQCSQQTRQISRKVKEEHKYKSKIRETRHFSFWSITYYYYYY